MAAKYIQSALWIGHRYLDLLKPSFQENELSRLIFPTLARLPRYNVIGTRQTWTVGQHLLLGLRLYQFRSRCGSHDPGPDTVETERVLKWGWIAHDAAEAFIGDKTMPLKRAERILQAQRDGVHTPFDEIEHRVHQAISEHWLLPHLGQAGDAIRDRIHYLDMLSAKVEKYYLVAPLAGEWPGLPEMPWGEGAAPPTSVDDDFHRIASLTPEQVTHRLTRAAKLLKLPPHGKS